MIWKIPLSDLDFGEEESRAVQEVLKSRWLTMGSVTQDFEAEFGAYVGTKHALAVTNCTAALHLACMALELGPGDEVIVPSLTFVATANAVRYVGATPVFADIESEQDLSISPAAIEKCITERTRAIIVVHYAGYACEMPRILALAKAHNLAVIEDAAHASGSFLDGNHLGNWGEVGCYSFFSSKNMTTGEGGMVTTNRDDLAAKIRILRSHGMTSLTWDRHQGHAWSYDVVALGYNYRIDEIRSALGREQLKKLEGNNAVRQRLTILYREVLHELAPTVTVPYENHRGNSAYHLMPILLPAGTDRVRFMDQMKVSGVQTSIHYPPIHTFHAYMEIAKENAPLPVTEDVTSREVTLPLYPGLNEEQVKFVGQAVRDALHSAGQ